MARSFAAPSGSVIHIEERGAGPPLLAIHGLGGGAYFFHGLADRLAGRGRVLAVDLPGTGNSRSGVDPFSAESWVDDLGAFAETIGEPVVLLGHSLGTILALKLWGERPHCVRAMIFAGGLPAPRPMIRQRLSEREGSIGQLGLAGWGPRVSAGVFSPATMSEQPELVGLFERLFEAQNDVAYLRALRILLGASAEALVETVRVPCLAVTGADDQYAPPVDVAVFAGRLGDRCPLEVIPHCGHLPFLEAPNAFASIVGAFLDRL